MALLRSSGGVGERGSVTSTRHHARLVHVNVACIIDRQPAAHRRWVIMMLVLRADIDGQLVRVSSIQRANVRYICKSRCPIPSPIIKEFSTLLSFLLGRSEMISVRAATAEERWSEPLSLLHIFARRSFCPF